MNFLDQYLLAFFNQFSRHSATFDKAIAFLSDQQLFKGGVLVTYAMPPTVLDGQGR